MRDGIKEIVKEAAKATRWSTAAATTWIASARAAFVLAAIGATLAATLGACGSDGGGSGYGSGPGDAPPDGHTVVGTASLAFDPGTLTVDAGTAVTFAFRSVAHNVFFDAAAGAPANIEGQNANASIARTFPTAGTYHFSCHIHPSMHGTVVVR